MCRRARSGERWRATGSACSGGTVGVSRPTRSLPPKPADLVGIYLSPPDHAVVLCVDEKPSIQALERAQGYLRLPNGQALKGFNHEYERHGTTTLFAALNVSTGQVKAGHYHRRRRREFLDFMNEVVADYPQQEIHVVLDNLSSHKPKRDRWRARHPNVHWHYTPTHASWLNQVEIWFSILTRQALRGREFYLATSSPGSDRPLLGNVQCPSCTVRMAEERGA